MYFKIKYFTRTKKNVSLKRRENILREASPLNLNTIPGNFIRSNFSLNPSGFAPPEAHNENFLNVELKGSANSSNLSHQGKCLYFAHREVSNLKIGFSQLIEVESREKHRQQFSLNLKQDSYLCHLSFLGSKCNCLRVKITCFLFKLF